MSSLVAIEPNASPLYLPKLTGIETVIQWDDLFTNSKSGCSVEMFEKHGYCEESAAPNT